MALAGAAAMLGGCTTVGPDFERPHVPWLADWTGGSLETARRRPAAPAQWLDAGVVAQLQRPRARPARSPRRSASIPTCGSPACASWKRAPSSALPTARAIRRCSRRPAQLLGVGEQRSGGRDTSAWTANAGFNLGWETRLLGQVQAQHRVGGRRLSGQHRPVRRRAGADGGPGGRPVLLDPHGGSCGCGSPARTRSCKSAAWRSRSCMFKSGNESELDVQQAKAQYLGTLVDHPPAGDRAAPDAERLEHPAGPAAGPLARDGRRARSGSRRPTWTSSSTCRPTCCDAARTCGRRKCSWPRSPR